MKISLIHWIFIFVFGYIRAGNVNTSPGQGISHNSNRPPPFNPYQPSIEGRCRLPIITKSVTIAYDDGYLDVDTESRRVFQEFNIRPTYRIWGEINFKAKKFIGGGKFGMIIAAENRATNRMVALKILRKIDCTNGIAPEFEFMPLLRDIADRVNVAAPYNAYNYGEFKVLEFQLFETDLFNQMLVAWDRQTVWQVETLQKLAKQMLDVLQELHRHDIIHSDIKPENIFVSRDGDYYLGDFGVALRLPIVDPESISGTTEYMAPESLITRRISKGNDIWALGITLLTLVMEHFDQVYIRQNSLFLRVLKPIPKPLRDFFMKKKQKNLKLQEISMQMASDRLVLSAALDFMEKTYGDDLQRYRLLKDFLLKCLEIDPSRRITAQNALRHPFVLDYTATHPSFQLRATTGQ